MKPLRLEAFNRNLLFASALCAVVSGCGVPEPASRPQSEVPPGTANLPEIDERAIGAYKVGRPYQISGIWYYPKVEYDYVETGIASWYGPGFHGRSTANGETYDQDALTAAHRTLPLPSMVQVTNLENGRSLILRLNDRGPFKRGRIIDLSKRAADLLGVTRRGTAKVRVQVLEQESRMLAALARGLALPKNRPQAAPTIAVTAVPLDPPQKAAPEPPVDSIGTLASEVAPEAVSQTTAIEAAPVEAGPRLANGIAAIAPGPAFKPRKLRRGPPRPPGLWRHRRAIASARAAGAPTDVQLAALPGAQIAPDLLNGSGVRPRLSEENIPWPDGEITQRPASPSNLYVQAGSFLRRDYATRFSRRLSVHGRSGVTHAQVDGRWFFRVRVGPLESVKQADRILSALYGDGITDARIVVDDGSEPK